VVRLTRVRCLDASQAPLIDPLTDPATVAQPTQEITEVWWAAEDALPFPLCVSALTDEAHGGTLVEDVSVARGNLVIADHGRTLASEDIGEVPQPHLFTAPAGAERCDAHPPVPVPPRFRPALAHGPLTQAGGVWVAVDDAGYSKRARVAFDPGAPAAEAFAWEMRDVWPEVTLEGTVNGEGSAWTPRRTLLNSSAAAREFVAEIDDGGIARLRFGDDQLGRRPDAGTAFTATYRVGNGAAGNVGAESIAHLVATETVAALRNPLPAAGGVDPESMTSARRRAPEAFRRQERAVTRDDYEEVVRRHPGVQNAAATLRWTGSWHTVFVTVDRAGGMPLTPDVSTELGHHVDRYRMAGHDVTFREPRFVPLELALHVCVKPNWFRSDVKRALLERLGSWTLADGRHGLFHSDNLTFGETLYLSRIYAAAHEVPGVESAVVTAFRRQYSTDEVALAEGRVALDRLEIARLDNDPNYPERGVIALDLHGGK
jgi:hypothetical protein